MEFMKEQNKELDINKQTILKIESLIVKSETDLDLYHGTENTCEYTKSLDMIEFGNKKIREIVNSQSLSLNISYGECLDLIFDREYAFELVKNNSI